MKIGSRIKKVIAKIKGYSFFKHSVQSTQNLCHVYTVFSIGKWCHVVITQENYHAYTGSVIFCMTNKKDGYRQLNVRQLISWVAYAPGTIAVYVTLIEREFTACQTHRSMYTS